MQRTRRDDARVIEAGPKARGAVAPHAKTTAGAADIERLDRLAGWLDDRFRIPGTGIRMGLDGIVGLVPGIGDTATGLLSAYILMEGWRLGVGKRRLARMGGNVAIDYVIGLVPLAGDIFDIGFKANRRNIEHIREHVLQAGGTVRRRA